jgi:hypothetical protein
MRKSTVLLSCLTLFSASTAHAETGNLALHEQCRLAIERETPFTTEENLSSVNGQAIDSISASLEEMERAREGSSRTPPLRFLSQEEFASWVSWREATPPEIVTAIFNGYAFGIVRKRSETFVQVISAGKPCGAWPVKAKPEGV